MWKRRNNNFFEGKDYIAEDTFELSKARTISWMRCRPEFCGTFSSTLSRDWESVLQDKKRIDKEKVEVANSGDDEAQCGWSRKSKIVSNKYRSYLTLIRWAYTLLFGLIWCEGFK